MSRGLVHLLDSLEHQAELIKSVTERALEAWDLEEEESTSALLLVVDKIATPDQYRTAQLLHASRKNLRGAPFDSIFNPLPEVAQAAEGIAYHASTHEAFKLPNGDGHGHVTDSSDALSSSNDAPLLTIGLEDHSSVRAARTRAHTRLQIPLAITLFQNGSKHTAFLASVAIKHGKPIVGDLSRLNSNEYPVILPWPKILRVGRMNSGISEEEGFAADGAGATLPLTPLTPVRPIASCMGNIITKLQGPGKDAEIPASQELEQAVAQYLNEQDAAPQTLTVWSLVVPAKVVQEQRSLFSVTRRQWSIYSKDPQALSYMISQWVWRGAKLRRVLSGGGGWGQKAGLLSLDPDDQYKAKPADVSLMPSFLTDIQADQAPKIANIAKRNDSIAFFAFVDEAVRVKSPTTTARKALQPQSPWSLAFGVTPSTVDDVVSPTEPFSITHDNQNKFEVHTGHFGALSEGGLCLERPSENVRTKLDVPNSRFSFSTVGDNWKTTKSAETMAPNAVGMCFDDH